MDEAKTLKRNLLFNTAGNVIYFACQWLVTGFFVKRLSEASLGDYNAGLLATAMAATNIFLTIASYGMRTYQVSDVSNRYSSGDYIRSRLVTCFAAAALCGVYAAFVGYSKEQTLCVFIWLFYKLLEAVTDVFHGCCQKRERMDIIGISYAARGVLGAATFCASLYRTQNLASALFAMTAVCWIFSCLYDILGTAQFYRPVERADYKKVFRLLAECFPLALYGLFNTATSNIPRLFLERISGTETAGIYNLVNSPVLILQVGMAFLFAPFITTFANKLESRDFKGFVKLAAYMTAGVLAVGAAGAAGVLLIGKWGLKFLYGADIAAHSGLLVPMVVCTVFTSLVLLYCMLLTVLREMKGLVLSTLFGIIASLVISRPLIAARGLFGTTWATIISLAAETAALAAFGLARIKKEKGRAEGDGDGSKK